MPLLCGGRLALGAWSLRLAIWGHNCTGGGEEGRWRAQTRGCAGDQGVRHGWCVGGVALGLGTMGVTEHGPRSVVRCMYFAMAHDRLLSNPRSISLKGGT